MKTKNIFIKELLNKLKSNNTETISSDSLSCAKPSVIEEVSTPSSIQTSKNNLNSYAECDLDLIKELIALQNNMDEKIMQEDYEPSYFTSENPLLVETIQKIENNLTSEMGSGVHKKGYRFLTYILLKQVPNAYIGFTDKQTTSNFLRRDYKVNTPELVGNILRDDVLHNGDFNITYEIQKLTTGIPLAVAKPSDIIFFLSTLKNCQPYQLGYTDNLAKTYNASMLKHRALNHIPHIENFLEGFTVLNNNGMIDYHGKNVHFSEKYGYSFIDLGYRGFSENFNGESLKSIFEKNMERTPDYNHFFSKLYGTLDLDKKFMLNDFYYNREYFPEYVYLGVLTKQILNVMKSTTSPLLPDARFYANHVYNQENFFSAPPDFLDQLYSAFKTNNSSFLQEVKNQFCLDEDFDFDKTIDSESFIKAMDLTYAMEHQGNLEPTN